MGAPQLDVEIVGKGRDLVLLHSLLSDRSSYEPLAARIGGHISLIGTVTGLSGEVPTAAMMIKQVRLQGLIVGNRRQQQDMVRALDTLALRPVIDRRFRLDALADAFRHEESGTHIGKICVEF